MDFVDLSDAFPLKFDVERMAAELEKLRSYEWLGHYDPSLSTDWTAIPLVSVGGLALGAESQMVGDYSKMKRTAVVDELPYFKEILDAFKCPQGRIRITRLNSGTVIGLHRDIDDEVANLAFNQVRLHIPIMTNDDVYFCVGGTIIRMAPGHLYYVNFSKKHYVNNGGETPRYHLVLDLYVNDWLRQYFPEPTFKQALSMKWQRIYLPVEWKITGIYMGILDVFWKNYEGSALQRFRHRFFPKKQRAYKDELKVK